MEVSEYIWTTDLSYLLLITTFLIIILQLILNVRELPPGPWGLPVFGYLPFVGKYPEIKLAGLSKIYGNVMSLSLGSNLAIVLGDYTSIKEAYIKYGHIFSGRPKQITFKLNEDDKGIVFNEGSEWQQQRRFALSVLREYGMGKLSLEPKIQEEIGYFLNEIANFKGHLFDPQRLVGLSISNVVSALAFGRRFNYDDEKFRELRHLLDKSQKFLGTIRITAFFPFVCRLPFFNQLTNLSKAIEYRQQFDRLVHSLVKEHEKDYDEGSQKDYIDAYLTQQKHLLEQTGSVGCFDYKWLEGNLVNLFSAGSETTSSLMRWIILYMIAYPKVQARIQKEIDSVVGMTRFPSITDRPHLPYTEATLMEVQRCSSIIPLNVVHSNVEEVCLFGYRIPKRSYVISNLWAVHHDPKLWENPDEFLPERFLDANGEVTKSDYLIPFSIGKRSCVGESLAKMELFLYTTSMLQRFFFHPPEGATASLAYDVGIVRAPLPFYIRATPRENYDVN